LNEDVDRDSDAGSATTQRIEHLVGEVSKDSNHSRVNSKNLRGMSETSDPALLSAAPDSPSPVVSDHKDPIQSAPHSSKRSWIPESLHMPSFTHRVSTHSQTKPGSDTGDALSLSSIKASETYVTAYSSSERPSSQGLLCSFVS
jgi:hypothetical protein